MSPGMHNTDYSPSPAEVKKKNAQGAGRIVYFLVFPFKSNFKNLEPSYKMGLDFLGCFRWKIKRIS